MSIEVSSKRDIKIISISGPIRAGKEYELADEIEKILDREKTPKLIIDLKGVTFMNSGALGVLLNINKRVDDLRGHFALCGANKEIEKLFTITKLINIIEIYKNIDEALESYED